MATYVPDVGGLDPQQSNYLDAAKRRLRDNYALGIAQNKFQQKGLTNQYHRGRSDLMREFGRAREQLPGNYAKRGLLNSGLYQQAIGRFGQERTAAFNNLGGQYNDEAEGLRLAYQQMGQVRDQGLNDVAQDEAARRAALAASLRGVG